jgi:hypothetical protein
MLLQAALIVVAVAVVAAHLAVAEAVETPIVVAVVFPLVRVATQVAPAVGALGVFLVATINQLRGRQLVRAS